MVRFLGVNNFRFFIKLILLLLQQWHTEKGIVGYLSVTLCQMCHMSWSNFISSHVCLNTLVEHCMGSCRGRHKSPMDYRCMLSL